MIQTHRRATHVAAALAGVLALGVAVAPRVGLRAQGRALAARVVLIVVDGLRPDQVTAAVMPRLHALGQRGTVFDAHHAAVPTVTRVNAPTMATGSYPERHGVLGNTIYSPKTFAEKGVNTGSHHELEAMATAEGGLLTTTTLGQTLSAQGKRLAIYSAGSSGSAFLLATPFPAGVSVVNPELLRPALPSAVVSRLGPGPKESVPNAPRNAWIVDAWRDVSSPAPADLTIFWFADPDETAHATGLGEQTARALTAVDAEIGRIEDTLRARNALADTAILVTSDHGFSTHSGELRLAALVAPFAQPLPDGTPDLVVTEGAINARRPLPTARLEALVSALQARPEVGAIFTAAATPESDEGVAPGTLAFGVAHWQHARSGVALVSGNWSATANAAGVPGTTTQTGTAGHGTTSPFDVRATLIASGPMAQTRDHSTFPTANADLAPTILTLLGLPVPAAMTGRVIRELLSGPEADAVHVVTPTSRSRDGRYTITAHITEFAGRRYLDHTEVTRLPAAR